MGMDDAGSTDRIAVSLACGGATAGRARSILGDVNGAADRTIGMDSEASEA